MSTFICAVCNRDLPPTTTYCPHCEREGLNTAVRSESTNGSIKQSPKRHHNKAVSSISSPQPGDSSLEFKQPIQTISQWFRFATGASIIGVSVFFVSSSIHELAPWAVATFTFILAVAIMLPGIYISTLRRIHENTLFRRDGLLYRFRTKRLLMTLGWFLWSIGISFFTLLQLNMFTSGEWTAFFLSFPIYFFIHRSCYWFLSKHVDKLHIPRISLSWACAISPFTTLIVIGFFVSRLEPSLSSLTLQELLNAKRAHLLQSHGSALVDEALQIFTAFSAAQDYVGNKLGPLSATLSNIVSSLSLLAVGYTSSSVLSCLMIPSIEYRRLFGSMTGDHSPPPVKPIKVAVWSSLIVFFFAFVYLHGFVAVETGIRHNPQWKEERGKLERVVLTQVEEIAGHYYTPGTIRQIQEARARSIQAGDASLAALNTEIDAAFDGMASNVDTYLDWYYSLPAEYARLGYVLTGSGEDYLASQLTEHLNRNDPFGPISDQISEIVRSNQVASDFYQAQKSRILSTNRINAPEKSIDVIARLSNSELNFPATHPTITSIENRMVGAGTVSVASGLITAKIVSKVIGKTLFKIAGKGVAKIAVSKTGGALAVAAVGAGIGSVVPVVGTFAGGVIGLAVGLVSGVVIDYALINLEEFVSRDAFRKELLMAISDSRDEFKGTLFGGQDATENRTESTPEEVSQSIAIPVSDSFLNVVAQSLNNSGAPSEITEYEVGSYWIEGSYEGVMFFVFPDACDQSNKCNAIQFAAIFDNYVLSDSQLSEVVSEMQGIEAYLDEDGKIFLQMSIDLAGGPIAEPELSEKVGYWTKSTVLFHKRIEDMDTSY